MARIVVYNPEQKRKLATLRKELGKDLGDKAFLEWRSQAGDPLMGELEGQVKKLVQKGLKIPPAGLKITRGRGGSIHVSKAEAKPRKATTKRAKKASKKVAKLEASKAAE